LGEGGDYLGLNGRQGRDVRRFCRILLGGGCGHG
jgi:hypothetical protein